jgi:hypothetical protein
MPNLDQLLSETNDELKYGYKLLGKFNRFYQIELSDNSIKNIFKVAKSKISQKKLLHHIATI